MFQQLKLLRPDPILGLMAKFRGDSASAKVDLGVGVYRDSSGNTPILQSVRRAEQIVLASQTSKAYVAAAGRIEFNTAVEALVLGEASVPRSEGRVRSIQTPGGCGAVRLGAELLRAAAPDTTVHVSDPTWGNHIPLLGSSGLKLATYPYYDAPSSTLKFAEMLEHLEQAAPGDVVLVHACCHNPSGADLDAAQWQALIELLQRRRLTPFLDMAYQGFAIDLDADAAGVRKVVDAVPEALVAVSFSKNLGLYRERTGALLSSSASSERADVVQSHALQIARSIYSMPPDHGAAIAACIFNDVELRESWVTELAAMRARMQDMRVALARHLRHATRSKRFDFIEKQHGMFSLLGVERDCVERLRERHHIYMTADSRMNIAGIMPHNVEYVATAVASEL